MISKVRQHPKFNLGQLNAFKLMFAMKISMETPIKRFWIAGFFLPAINATVFNIQIYFSILTAVQDRKTNLLLLATILYHNHDNTRIEKKTLSKHWEMKIILLQNLFHCEMLIFQCTADRQSMQQFDAYAFFFVHIIPQWVEIVSGGAFFLTRFYIVVSGMTFFFSFSNLLTYSNIYLDFYIPILFGIFCFNSSFNSSFNMGFNFSFDSSFN